MSAPPAQWLDEHISQLLASPHIHFTQPSIPGLQIRMGPGPIDLFGTRFANLFAQDVTGVVNGNEVDRNGLKDQLLKLQKTYNKDSAKFTPQQATGDDNTVSTMSWERRDTNSEVEVTMTASVKEHGGAPRISFFKMDGASDLLG